MAYMATCLCLLILSPLFLFNFNLKPGHKPSPSRKLFESATSSLFIPPAAGDVHPTFPSFQEPLLPPGPVANYLIPNLPMPSIPSFPTIPDSLPTITGIPMFPSLPFPPGLLYPGRPFKKNQQKNIVVP